MSIRAIHFGMGDRAIVEIVYGDNADRKVLGKKGRIVVTD